MPYGPHPAFVYLSTYYARPRGEFSAADARADSTVRLSHPAERSLGTLWVVTYFEARLAAFAGHHVLVGVLRLVPPAPDRLRAQIESLHGHLRHARTERVCHRCLARYPWLHQC